MRSERFGILLCILLFTSIAHAQQAQSTLTTSNLSPVRDAQAVAVLQQAVKVMGGNVPTDSIATGTATIVAGSSTDQGTVRILTRGTSQTFEKIQSLGTEIAEVYSDGQASQIVGSTVKPLSGNRATTAQCRDFPLPLLAALLANPDESLQFLGLDQDGTATMAHIRATNTFASQPGWQVLSEFTPTDIWVDTQTALPDRIAWTQRDGGGASPRIRRETLLSNYRSFGGVLYPGTIQEFYNGTLWITITVENVSYNTGLSVADFPVAEVQQ
jgi:hypothetical protein